MGKEPVLQLNELSDLQLRRDHLWYATYQM
ncbi:hypothetical protein ATJ97_0035 [Georgenia soli]|uniref:Uncharacterized protein n=1 Tax=Georgenia soli TaxID=638953 RepID=A0A2A9F3T4_9MICO|nr:hypothetical protein ATJ97_0035 [Georgenia soli]